MSDDSEAVRRAEQALKTANELEALLQQKDEEIRRLARELGDAKQSDPKSDGIPTTPALDVNDTPRLVAGVTLGVLGVAATAAAVWLVYRWTYEETAFKFMDFVQHANADTPEGAAVDAQVTILQTVLIARGFLLATLAAVIAGLFKTANSLLYPAHLVLRLAEAGRITRDAGGGGAGAGAARDSRLGRLFQQVADIFG